MIKYKHQLVLRRHAWTNRETYQKSKEKIQASGNSGESSTESRSGEDAIPASIPAPVTSLPPADPIFGIPLAEAVTKASQIAANVPDVVTMCVVYLKERALDEEGLFRLSGSATKIKELKDAVDNGLSVDLNEIQDEHVITGLLKLYLRELPTEILPRYAVSANKQDAIFSLREILYTLPTCNHALLSVLFDLLHEVAQHSESNKMSVKNLAIVFSPTLGCSAEMVSCLIENYGEIFHHDLIQL